MAVSTSGGDALHTGDEAAVEETTLDLRVASILIILVAGLLGALSPLHVKAWRDPHNLLQRLTRSFSAGAILALAIIHVMPDAYEALGKSMQEERGKLTGGSTVLLGIFAMVVIESMANQMLCPNSQSPVHVHGCNQYHASRAPTLKTALSDALGGDGDDASHQPLLAADMLGDAGAHVGVHGSTHQAAEQEEDGSEGGWAVAVDGPGERAQEAQEMNAVGAAPAGEWDVAEGGCGEGVGVGGGHLGCKSSQQQQQQCELHRCGAQQQAQQCDQHEQRGCGGQEQERGQQQQEPPRSSASQRAVGVESKPEPLAGVAQQQTSSKAAGRQSSQCPSQQGRPSMSSHPHLHSHQGSARARQHPLHLQHLQGQLQQHGHQHHNARDFLHLPHQQQGGVGRGVRAHSCAHTQLGKHGHGLADGACAIPVEEPQDTSGHPHHHDHHHHHHHHGICDHGPMGGSHAHHDHGQSLQRKVMAYMLELGCVFHSLFIGLSLGVTVEGRPQVYALVIALAVHQLLEGLALGSVVAAANFGKYSGMSMAVMYSLTTPIGVALGIMASSYYETMSSSVGLTVQGLANAVSAGMLLYIALVQLITEHNKYVALQYTAKERGASHGGPHGPPSRSTILASPASVLNVHSPRHQSRICFVPVTVLMSHASLVTGAALMWAMGFWS